MTVDIRQEVSQATGPVPAVLPPPRAARWVAWANAWLAGIVSADAVTDGIVGDDWRHRVHLSRTDDDRGDASVALAIGRWRQQGITRWRLVLPVPGDPRGLPGPTAVNAAAMEAGEIAVGVGIPGRGVQQVSVIPRWLHNPPDVDVQWQALFGATESQLWDRLTVRDAGRELGEAITATITTLDRVAAERWRAELSGWLTELRRRPDPGLLPPTYSPDATLLLTQAQRIRSIVTVTEIDREGAVSASALRERSVALRSLDGAARRAVVTAINEGLDRGGADRAGS
jgi:hypothetical protein